MEITSKKYEVWIILRFDVDIWLTERTVCKYSVSCWVSQIKKLLYLFTAFLNDLLKMRNILGQTSRRGMDYYDICWVGGGGENCSVWSTSRRFSSIPRLDYLETQKAGLSPPIPAIVFSIQGETMLCIRFIYFSKYSIHLSCC